MSLKLKLSKIAWRIKKYSRKARASKREFSLAQSEHKEYVRAKRNIHNLPCFENTGTQWIKRIKNWKHRAKVSHSWEKHEISKQEDEVIYNDQMIRNEIFYNLSKLKDGEWYPFYDKHEFNHVVSQLIIEKKIEPLYKFVKDSNLNYGVITLIGIRIYKERINEEDY